MTAEQLLRDVTARGVALSVDGDHLRWKATAGCVTPAMLSLLRAHKAELLRLLAPTPPVELADDAAAREATALREEVEADAADAADEGRVVAEASERAASREMEDRRAFYVYARTRGFPRVVLPVAQRTVDAGESNWRAFAQREGYYALFEAGIELETRL